MTLMMFLSHGTQEQHRETLRRVRKVASRRSTPAGAPASRVRARAVLVGRPVLFGVQTRIDLWNREMLDLVADVAHELRTPIAILQAGHEALLDGVAEPTPAELGSLRDEVLPALTVVPPA